MRLLLCLCCLAAACAQAPAPAPKPVPPETVVATVDGKPVTAAEVQGLYRTVGPQVQQSAMKDPKTFLTQYGMIRRLAEKAEKNKLDQKSPYKETLAAARTQILQQAQIQQVYEDIILQGEEQKKFYEANQDRYTQAKVKVIYIPFSGEGEEAKARAKAEGLVRQIRGGADFVKLVKEHSQDPASKDKDGDFPPIGKTDKIPENIKAAVFALKKGEISEPVRAPNGFYVFRGEEALVKPYDAVRDEIFNELKLARLREFMESTQKSVQVKIENEAFFAQAAAGGAAPGK
ncbi:MAG: peptidylprolyl isomerase [Acidobacteriota bacterium]